MPHAALWVVQRIFAVKSKYGKICFNAARGFVGGAGKEYPFYFERVKVSMPHAALWVVQPVTDADKLALGLKFQCRTRLCGWCSVFSRGRPSGRHDVSMPHAALWVVQPCMVGGTLSLRLVSMPHAAVSFRPHHRFAVPLPRSRRGGLVRLRFLVESRNISFPRRCGGSGERSEPIGAPMPHAALWVVQRRSGA